MNDGEKVYVDLYNERYHEKVINLEMNLKSTKDKIIDLILLDENWDGEGAPILRRVPVENALRLEPFFSEYNPFVAPTHEGGLQFEMIFGDADVEIYFMVSGDIDYLITYGEDNYGEGSIRTYYDMRSLLVEVRSIQSSVGLVDEKKGD